jgi:hypothetical protein
MVVVYDEENVAQNVGGSEANFFSVVDFYTVFFLYTKK